MVNLLLEKGADINCKDKKTGVGFLVFLYVLCLPCFILSVYNDRLLKHIDRIGVTPLICAIIENQAETIEKLLESKV